MNRLNDPYLVFHASFGDLDGNTFMSGDSYGHLCTVSGAKWQPDGRNFDGIDDEIACGNGSGPLSIQGAYSILVWFKTTTMHNGVIVSKDAHDGDGNHINYRIEIRNNNTINVRHGNATGDASAIRSIPFVPDGVWHMAWGTYDMSCLRAGLDDEEKVAPLSCDYVPYTSTCPLNIGLWYSTVYPFNGRIGEVLIYRRQLSPFEIQQNYLSARWRYK